MGLGFRQATSIGLSRLAVHNRFVSATLGVSYLG
jgi:hypothetical protein